MLAPSLLRLGDGDDPFCGPQDVAGGPQREGPGHDSQRPKFRKGLKVTPEFLLFWCPEGVHPCRTRVTPSPKAPSSGKLYVVVGSEGPLRRRKSGPRRPGAAPSKLFRVTGTVSGSSWLNFQTHSYRTGRRKQSQTGIHYGTRRSVSLSTPGLTLVCPSRGRQLMAPGDRAGSSTPNPFIYLLARPSR